MSSKTRIMVVYGVLAYMVGWEIAGIILTGTPSTAWWFVAGFWFCYLMLYLPARRNADKSQALINEVHKDLTRMVVEINKKEKEKAAEQQSLQE
jgi:hypothetical protein